MRSFRLAAAGFAAMVVLAGCAAPDDPVADVQTLSAPSAESTEAAQVRETGLTRPALVFDGRCDLLFSDAELFAVMGEHLELDKNHFVELWGGDALFNQNGGLECTWWGEYARVVALVLPEAAVGYVPQDYECGTTHDTGVLNCAMESVVNGIRLSGLSGLGLDPVAAVSARDALLSIFAEKAAQVTPVPVPLPAVGSWRLTPSCDAAAAADFTAVPGLGAGATDAGPPGYGKDTTQAEGAFAQQGYSPSCVLVGESADLEYVASGGARWREPEIGARADAMPLALEGVEVAYGVPYADGKTLVYAFSGPNMLAFTVRFTKNAAGIATAFFASLDATAVS